MCNVSGVVFGATALRPEDLRGKRVIEVGSLDVNGSLRPILESWQPASYLGVDVSAGPGVDLVCPCEELVARLGPEGYDVVISTEMLEHVRDWRQAISQLKGVCAPGGLILLSTRSLGFPYHGYPYDFWRFDLADMRAIFADCEILVLQADPQDPGVFVLVRKPETFSEADLSGLAIESIITGQRQLAISDSDFNCRNFRRLRFKQKLKATALGLGKAVFSRI